MKKFLQACVLLLLAAAWCAPAARGSEGSAPCGSPALQQGDSAPTPPTFRGGNLTKFRDWLENQLNRPRGDDFSVGSEPVQVRFSFAIDTAGRVCDVEFLTLSLSLPVKERVMRALERCPAWEPARVDGRAVRVRLIQNVAVGKRR